MHEQDIGIRIMLDQLPSVHWRQKNYIFLAATCIDQPLFGTAVADYHEIIIFWYQVGRLRNDFLQALSFSDIPSNENRLAFPDLTGREVFRKELRVDTVRKESQRPLTTSVGPEVVLKAFRNEIYRSS